MKKLLILPVLGIAFFPLLTSAEQSELCTDCLDSNEDYLSCVGRDTEFSCEYLSDMDFVNCSDQSVMCGMECENIDDEGERESCFDGCNAGTEECENQATSSYNSCVAGCQTNYCGIECLPTQGGGNNTQGGGTSSNGLQVLSSNQVQGMGTALTNGGSGLLRILIQLMPYAIAFTIILIIFGLIKNRSHLKNSFNGSAPFVNILGRKWANKHPDTYNKYYRRWDKRSAKRLARKFGGDPKGYYMGKGGAW